MVNEISNRERIKITLRNMLELHLDEYVSRVIEVGGFGVGGVELEVTIPSPRIIRGKIEKEQSALIVTINALWQNAAMSYVYGNFRACIFQIGSMLEGILKYEILRRELKKSLEDYLKKQFPTLGNLIYFCKYKNIILSKENNSLEFAEKINKIRNDHVHLILERERPNEIFETTSRDEFIFLDKFIGEPPVKIKNGWVSGDGVTVVFDFKVNKTGILYKYKKDAKKCLNYVRQILKTIYKDE